MDEKSSLTSMVEPDKSTTEKSTVVQEPGPSSERADNDQRKAYGTAKTENLRDSGLWRILLPAVVIICCIALFVIPLVILIPLLYNSITAIGSTHVQDHN